jgi:hypothetical protein
LRRASAPLDLPLLYLAVKTPEPASAPPLS